MKRVTITDALNNECGLHLAYAGGTIYISGYIDGEDYETTNNDTLSYDRYNELKNDGYVEQQDYDEFVQLYQYFVDCLLGGNR